MSIPQRIFHRIGRRGAALLLLSVVWFIIGLDIIQDPDPDRAYRLPLEYLDPAVRAALWWGPAAVAAITAFWPPRRTTWGFALLLLPVSARAFSYGFTMLLAVIEPAIEYLWEVELNLGHFDTWDNALVWGVIVLFLLILTGWDEPVDASDADPALVLPPLPPEAS